MYDNLAAKVNNIDTNAFCNVLKIKYQTNKIKLEKKNPDGIDFVKTKNSLN